MTPSLELIESIGKSLFDRYSPFIGELTRGYHLPDQLPFADQIPYGWSCWDGAYWQSIGDQLNGFVGYIDLETGGLESCDGILCAVGVGTLPLFCGDIIVVYLPMPGDEYEDLGVINSVIANWNQPFDRQFYRMNDDLTDPNIHLDIMGMDLMVRGKPEKWKQDFYADWHWITHTDSKLKTASWEMLGIDLDKGVRDRLVAGVDVPITETLEYCYQDSRVTSMVGARVICEYLCQCPNPITLYGHITRHRFVLPISESWVGYKSRAETWFQEQEEILASKVKSAFAGFHTEDDPWSRCFREQYPESYSKPGVKAIKENAKLAELILERYPDQPLPLYKKQWDDAGAASAVYALAMQLSWCEDPINAPDQIYPILYDRQGKQWYYMIGKERRVLENKGDPKKGLATPLCKDYDDEIKSGKLVLAAPSVRSVFKNSQRWKSFRSRVSALHPRRTDNGLQLVPNYSPNGTLTGRAVDRVTLLIGSPKQDYGGSEFMSMIEARPGHRIVQADLDSAELVLAGLVGAWFAGVSAELDEPFCKANLLGNKEDGTDTHTLNARACGIDRGIAKNLGYGATYLQGMSSRIALLERAGLSRLDATEKARMFTEQFIKGLAGNYFQGVRLITDHRMPTLLLGKKVPLAYRDSGDEGLTSRANHNIQALGEDMLNVITAIVEDQIGGFDGSLYLVLTRHDELVFHCKEDRVDELTKALQYAHYHCRRAILDILGIHEDAPDPWMHFQGVDVGNRYRKSPSSRASTCTTTFPEDAIPDH